MPYDPITHAPMITTPSPYDPITHAPMCRVSVPRKEHALLTLSNPSRCPHIHADVAPADDMLPVPVRAAWFQVGHAVDGVHGVITPSDECLARVAHAEA